MRQQYQKVQKEINMCCCDKPKSGAKEPNAGVKDVVCGMTIDPKSSAGQSEYDGETYYFCGLGCKRKFDANPAQFVQK